MMMNDARNNLDDIEGDEQPSLSPEDERRWGLRLVPSPPPAPQRLPPDEELRALVQKLRRPRRKPASPDEPPKAA